MFENCFVDNTWKSAENFELGRVFLLTSSQ